jgi:hypothetical protein
MFEDRIIENRDPFREDIMTSLLLQEDDFKPLAVSPETVVQIQQETKLTQKQHHSQDKPATNYLSLTHQTQF